MFNPIWVEKLQKGLLKHFEMGSLTRWMEGNAIGVDYKGGRKVTFTSLQTDGLGDYSRTSGYPRGDITGSKTEFIMTQDRGREFVIDAADHDETGFLVTAGAVIKEFQTNHVIPEVDSYRISKIYSTVNTVSQGENISDEDIPAQEVLDVLVGDIAHIRDTYIDSNVPLVIMMSGITQSMLGHQFVRGLEYQSFATGAVNTKVKSLDGDALMILPSRRLKSAYTFLDGTSSGEEEGGFAPAPGAVDITWMIVPLTAPIAVGKIDKLRVFTPEQYQVMHAWKIDYRLYHDLWLHEKDVDSIFIRTGEIVDVVEEEDDEGSNGSNGQTGG